MDKKMIKNAKNFDELLDIKYGKIGTEKRDDFEEEAQKFIETEKKQLEKAPDALLKNN